MKNLAYKNIILFILLLLTNLAFSQGVIIDAMQSELNRSKDNLAMNNSDKPYFIAYSVADHNKVDIIATFGGLLSSKESRSRNATIEIRIGDYHFDNSNFAGALAYGYAGRTVLPVEDDSYAIRFELWMATDKAYKAALDEFAKKKAAVQNRNYNDKVDDFSREKPETLIEEMNNFEIPKQEAEKKAIAISKIFRNYPEISNSSVIISCTKGNDYFVNTEGAKYRKKINNVEFEVTATAIDKKGNRYYNHVAFYGKDLKDLPDEINLAKAVEKMAGELTAIVKAPLADDYSGPVLFAEDASANFLGQVLYKSLSGKPAPFSTSSSVSNTLASSQLIRKIGRKILPDFISIYDDPTVGTYNGQILMGNYKIDDEGVLAQKVQMVENGVLKNLLMCRKPNSKVDKSNGHGRIEGPRKAEPRASNVFITSSEKKSYEDLKKELINTCREQELEFGIIIKKISDPVVYSRGIDSYSGVSSSTRSNEILVSQPALVYKVYVKDGKEELVKGYNFTGMNLKILKDITAAGSDSKIFNFKAKGSSGDILTSFISPSIMIDDLELIAEKDQNKKPPILPHPYFSVK